MSGRSRPIYSVALMRERPILDVNRVTIPDAGGGARKMKTFSTRLSFRSLAHELPGRLAPEIYRRMRRRYLYPTIAYSTLVLAPLFVLTSVAVLVVMWFAGLGQEIVTARAAYVIFAVQLTVYLVVSTVIVELIGFPFSSTMTVGRTPRRCSGTCDDLEGRRSLPDGIDRL